MAAEGKAATLAEPTQDFDDHAIADPPRRAAIVAGHKLAFVPVVDIGAGDIGADTLDLLDQLAGERTGVKRSLRPAQIRAARASGRSISRGLIAGLSALLGGSPDEGRLATAR